MAVYAEQDIQRYIGPTLGVKPVGVPVGSTYYDYELGILYKTYDGTNYYIYDPKIPYTYAISHGMIPNTSAWTKTGYNPNVGTTEEDMWYGSAPYVFPPTTGITMQVASTVTTDGIAGQGIQTAYIKYLNTSYVELSETITLNGTIAVSTAAHNIIRVNNFRAATAGSSGKALGDITLKNSTATVTYSNIATGYTRARNTAYTVPAGKTLYVTSIGFSSANNTSGMRMTTRANYDNVSGLNLSTEMFMPYSEVVLTAGSYTRQLEQPTRLPEKTDIKVSVICTGTSSGGVAFSSLRGYLETN